MAEKTFKTRSDEGLTLEKSAQETLSGGQSALSTRLINQIIFQNIFPPSRVGGGGLEDGDYLFLKKFKGLNSFNCQCGGGGGRKGEGWERRSLEYYRALLSGDQVNFIGIQPNPSWMVPKSPNFNVMYGISEFALHSVHFSIQSKKDESYCTLHI